MKTAYVFGAGFLVALVIASVVRLPAPMPAAVAAPDGDEFDDDPAAPDENGEDKQELERYADPRNRFRLPADWGVPVSIQESGTAISLWCMAEDFTLRRILLNRFDGRPLAGGDPTVGANPLVIRRGR